jgi:signal transduction histidine kinase
MPATSFVEPRLSRLTRKAWAALLGLSLRHKLTLFASGLAVGALLIAAALAYLEVRNSSRLAAEVRLESAPARLAGLLGPLLVARRDQEERIGSAGPMRAALAGRPFVPGELAVVLDSLRTQADGGLPVVVLGPDGEVVFSIGETEPDLKDLPPLGAEIVYGPFSERVGHVLYWVTIPVAGAGAHPAGWVAQRRRLGTSGASALVESLIGDRGQLILGRWDDSVWVNLEGMTRRPPPRALEGGAAAAFTRADGRESLGMVTPMDDLPWLVLLEIPMATVAVRAQVFLSRLFAVGSILILVVILVAWRSGAYLVVPLRQLADAAEAIAGGDYERRVPATGTDEVGRLARVFNTMAGQVARSHSALRESLGEAVDLAATLEAAGIQREQALEEAESSSRAKSQFLATMSHELRTPISAVVSYTELLRMGVPDQPTDRQREYLNRIDSANEMLAALVNDVLEYTCIESGQLRIHREVGSAAEAIRVSITTIEPRAKRKRIRLVSECAQEAAFVADGTRVRQIVLNLVSNAVKFTPEGGSVTVRCTDRVEGGHDAPERDGPWLRIDVEDDGVGIAPEELARVFEPFVQGEAGFNGDHAGAGLGLAISQRLARLMSGSISVVSEPGRGSCFTLWLPSTATSCRPAELRLA